MWCVLTGLRPRLSTIHPADDCLNIPCDLFGVWGGDHHPSSLGFVGGHGTAQHQDDEDGDQPEDLGQEFSSHRNGVESAKAASEGHQHDMLSLVL